MHKPSFSPAPIAAAFIALAIAAVSGAGFARVLRRPDYHPDRPAAIGTFLVSLILDVLWTGLFFGGRHPTVSLVAAGGLVPVAVAAVWRFTAVDRHAALLIVPRVFATGFAFLLALSISLLNS